MYKLTICAYKTQNRFTLHESVTKYLFENKRGSTYIHIKLASSK